MEAIFFSHEHKLHLQLNFRWRNKFDYQKETNLQKFLLKVKHQNALDSISPNKHPHLIKDSLPNKHPPSMT